MKVLLAATLCCVTAAASADEIIIPLDFEREVVLAPRPAALAAIQWNNARLQECCRAELARQPAERRDPGRIVFGDWYLNSKTPVPLSDLAEVRVQPMTFVPARELRRLALMLTTDESALRDLGKLGGRAKEIVPLLLPQIEKAQRYSQAQRFLFALKMLGPHAAEAVPALSEKVRKADKFDKSWYCEALADIGTPAVASLETLLRQEPDEFGRNAAARGLAKSGADGRKALRDALSDPQAEVRAAAVDALPGDADVESRRLVVALLADSAAPVRQTAAGKASLCLPAMKVDAVARLLRMLDESDQDSQAAALRGLASLHSQPQSVLPRLKPFLQTRGEASFRVRNAALYVTRQYGPAAADLTPQLIACLEGGDMEAVDALAALEAIGGRPAGAGVAQVVALTTHKNWQIADAATSALFTMGDAAVAHAPHLVVLLTAKSAGSRQHLAAQALVAVGPDARDALPALVPWLVSAGSVAYVPQEPIRWMAAIDLDRAVAAIRDDQRRTNRGDGFRVQDQRKGALNMLDRLRAHAEEVTDRAPRKEVWRPPVEFGRLLQRDWPRVVRKGDSIVRVIALLGAPDKVGGGKLIVLAMGLKPSPSGEAFRFFAGWLQFSEWKGIERVHTVDLTSSITLCG